MTARPCRSFSAGSADAFDGQSRIAGFLGDKPVLFFDYAARGSIAIEAAENFAWNAAIGPLRAVFVEYIEESEFCSRCRFSCHSQSPLLLSGGHAGSMVNRERHVQKALRDVA